MDPNSNGGLDSNGYQKCYLVNYEFGMSGTSQWAEARLDVTDVNSPSPNFGAHVFVYGFMSGFTTGASTGTDNGFLLLKPTVGGFKNLIAIGVVTTKITSGTGFGGTNGTGVAEIYNVNGVDLTTSVTVANYYYNSYGVGDVIYLQYDTGTSQWYPQQSQFPFIGKVNSAYTNIAAGSTGSIDITDDQGNAYTTLTGVRAIIKVYKKQQVLVFPDTANAELYCVPLPYAGAATDIYFQFTGSLAYSDATASVGSIVYYNGIAPTGTTTVNNILNFSMTNGGHGWATLIAYDFNTGNATYDIRAVNMTEWSGYDHTVIQALGHDASGNTKWYNTGACT